MAEKGKGGNLRAWIPNPMVLLKSQNLRIFLLCFLTAFIFWGLNSLNKDYQTSISMPLEVVYDDSLYIPLDPPPKKIPLQVSGYGWDLIRWTFGWQIDPIKLTPADLPESKSITYATFSDKITAKLQDLKLMNFIDPEEPINFDFLETRKVPIDFDAADIPFAENFYLKDSIVISSDTLSFTGPRSLLENLTEHYLLALPVDNIDKNYSSSLIVQLPHSELVQVEPENIELSFSVGQYELLEKNIPIFMESKKKKKAPELFPENEFVRIVFKLKEAEEFGTDFDSVEAFVDLDRLSKNDSTARIQLRKVPESAVMTVLFPDTVRLLASEGIQ